MLYDPHVLSELIPTRWTAGRMGMHSLTELDMQVLLALFHQHQPKRVLEFGIWEGYTASVMLQYCSTVETWVGVDLDPARLGSQGIMPDVPGLLVIGDSRLRLVLTDRTIEDLYAQLDGEPPFDALILDADHDELPTQRDTEGTDCLLRPGGLRVWHDYNTANRHHPEDGVFGVKAYLDRLMVGGREINIPNDAERNGWSCCSLAWEIAP